MKIGIYIDAANLAYSGGFNMRYDVLKDFCSIGGGELVRLNTYISYDAQKAEQDKEYREKQDSYFRIVRHFGFKILRKDVKWYTNEEGERYGKANADLDLAVDMLIQSRNLDKVFLLSGDGDFKRVVKAVQDKGVRVELIAFNNISGDLISECDHYIPGFIIPDLLPIKHPGKNGERYRGICYNVEDKFSFLRYINADFGYEEVFAHLSELRNNKNFYLDRIYEFSVDEGPKGPVAKRIVEVKF
ncbi:MAG: NYN domain-containing protein [Bacteroidia bacterium]